MAGLSRLLAPARFLRQIHRVESLLAMLLAALLMAVIVVSSLQLTVFVLQELVRPGTPWLGGRLNELLGDLLTLLIALEVLQNITAFLRRGEAQIQLVLLTAITALARKVIVPPEGVDSKPQLLIGLGVAVLSLSAAYWLVSRSQTEDPRSRTARARSFPEPDPSPPADDAARPEAAGSRRG